MTQVQHEAIERELTIKATPETVFSFFTEPEKLVQWMGTVARLEPRPGGKFELDYDGENFMRGEYVELVPYSRIVFTWGWANEGGSPRPGGSTVEVTLTPVGEGTSLRLRHIGLSAEERASHSDGWDHFLPQIVPATEMQLA